MARHIVLFALAAGVVLTIGFEALAVPSQPQLEYRLSAEMGEALVATFPPSVSRDEAVRNFRLVPPVSGEAMWFDDVRELHFRPARPFEPGQRYRFVWPGPGSLMARLVPEASSSAEIPAAPVAARSVEPAREASPMLPTSEIAFFQKANGERVGLDGPRTSVGKAIEINLSTMVIQLFDNGQRRGVFEASGKGNPDKTPTPTGRFKILKKRGTIFSNISRVWMPLSLQFYGPYYLHAIPYYPNGKAVVTQYSGGCIRMAPGADKKIYDWADVATAVVVYGA
ncbi:L,D-transpeptidase [Candidatus Parcubacteria bacterium]|nr:L,D-transpeptidase [Candidatus Parcubacteria bacterium]